MDLSAVLCVFSALFTAVRANEHHAHSISVSAPHMSYICPEGANVTLRCVQSGSKAQTGDRLQHGWFFTKHMDKQCPDHIHVRGIKPPHSNHTLGVMYEARNEVFSVTLLHLTNADQGRYCCVTWDVSYKEKHNKPTLMDRAFNHITVTIVPHRNDSGKCTEYDLKPSEVGSSVFAGVGTAAFILAVLCLPLILVLVYRQRQGAPSRRAHELVRMDSEAHGHENPAYMGSSPQPKIRSLSQILTRQSSETGRHLLSDPGTPLSPNPHGDVFFPSQEPIPESPDFLQV